MSKILKETEIIFKNRYNNFAKDEAFRKMDLTTLNRLDSLLDSLLQACFKFGLEHGKEEILLNIAMMEEDEGVKKELNTNKSSHKTPEALMLLLELYANKSLTFDDIKTARKKVDALRAYSKYNQLDFKFKQNGRNVYLVKQYEL